MSTEPLDLDAIRARVDADVTVGPWEWGDPGLPRVKLELRTAGGWKPYSGSVLRLHGEMLSVADAEFIAHARTDVPALLAEVAALREQLARSRAANQALAEQHQTAVNGLAELASKLHDAQRERDLAIAHDRQPYPTADAYERACLALDKHRERADRLAATVERVRAVMAEWSRVADADGYAWIRFDAAVVTLWEALSAADAPLVDAGTSEARSAGSVEHSGPHDTFTRTVEDGWGVANVANDPEFAPRTWALPAEPGPEVTAVHARDGVRWVRAVRNAPGWRRDRGGSITVSWQTMLREAGPLTDATGETGDGPALPCSRCGSNPPMNPGDRYADGTPSNFARYCASCIDRCHESTDFAHECAICAHDAKPATGEAP